MDVVMLLLLVLGVARVSGLLTVDEIGRPLRDWVINGWPRRWAGGWWWWSYVWTCPRCMSVWVGGFSAPVAVVWGHTDGFQIVAGALAASMVSVLLLAHIGRLDRE